MESIRLIHPDLPLVTVLVDQIDGYFDPATEPFQTLLASDLGIPRWIHFSMKYDIMELNTAVKPYAIQYLMEKFDAARVIYFDPDILVYNPLSRIFDVLTTQLCVLTPHITSPLNDNFSPSEIDFLRVGTYNLGFFALSKQGDWRGLLRWWQDRLYENCTREVDRGLFVDQHWMDLVPSLFADVYVLRDAGYNVAYWNLSHRELTFSAEKGYLVNGVPLVFFHFSGFSIKHPEAVSKHQNRFRFDNLNDATRNCYLDYRQRLIDQKFEETSNFPYAYGRFDNNVPITDLLRICLRNHDSRGEKWANPYHYDSPDGFLMWAVTPGKLPQYRYLSPYAITLYKTRPDLRAAFPSLENQNELAFATWFIEQHQPADVFSATYVEPIRDAISKGGITSAVVSREVITQSWYERLIHAARYYKNYPTKVKPYLPPEAFTHISVHYQGPNNIYGQTRNALRRLGILRAVKRMVGLRLVMTVREYFSGASSAPVEAPLPSFAPLINPISEAEIASEVVYGVTVLGYLRAETGVGQIARDIIMSLNDVQFPVTGYVLSSGDAYRQQDASTSSLTGRVNHFVQLFNVNADQTLVVRESLGANFYQNHYNIGYWFWELSSFPDLWRDAFESYDEIWVATKFVQKAIQAVSPKPVLCIPPAISVKLPEQSNRARFGLADDDFVVLFIFDALSIVERKNPWAVLQAFELAYTEQERKSKVRLVIKSTNLGQVPEGNPLHAEITRLHGRLMDDYLDRLEVNALISLCDVYISLHRSEGFGLTMAEAMYLGKPVIATAYSGNVDFMNEENSYLVPFNLVPLGKPYPPYQAHEVWANPDIRAAAYYLREIYEDYDSAKAKGAKAAQYIRQHYNFQTRGEKIAARLNLIHAKHFQTDKPTPPQKTNVSFCTLAIHAPYRERARLLCSSAITLPWFVLTDAPEDFEDLPIRAIRHIPTGPMAVDYLARLPATGQGRGAAAYHDKRFAIIAALEDFDTAIYMDADSHIQQLPPLGDFPAGLAVLPVVEKSIAEHLATAGTWRLPFFEDLARHLTGDTAILQTARWCHEALIAITKDGRESKFFEVWGRAAAFLQAREVYSGEGGVIGLAAAIAGWTVDYTTLSAIAAVIEHESGGPKQI